MQIKDDIEPLAITKVQVDFMPVMDFEEWKKGFWVIRIVVHPGAFDQIYRVINRVNLFELESYFREDGALVRLTIDRYNLEKQYILDIQRLNPRKDAVTLNYAVPEEIGSYKYKGMLAQNEQKIAAVEIIQLPPSAGVNQ